MKLALGHSAYDRYNGNRKHDRTIAELDINNWEAAASNRGNWRSVVITDTNKGEERKGHNCLRGEISESRDLPMLRSHNSLLCVSAAEAAEIKIVTPDSNFLVTQDDAHNQNDDQCAANHCHTRQNYDPVLM